MAFLTGYRSITPNRQLLIAAWVTSGLAAMLLSNDIYLLSPFAIDSLIERLPQALTLLPLYLIIAAPFGFFFVWPLALLGEFILSDVLHAAGWPSWIATGAALGVAGMAFYSLLLGLGFELWFALAANGALFGVICSTIARGLSGSQVGGSAACHAETSGSVTNPV